MITWLLFVITFPILKNVHVYVFVNTPDSGLQVSYDKCWREIFDWTTFWLHECTSQALAIRMRSHATVCCIIRHWYILLRAEVRIFGCLVLNFFYYRFTFRTATTTRWQIYQSSGPGSSLNFGKISMPRFFNTSKAG